jgi:hypothetical protein
MSAKRLRCNHVGSRPDIEEETLFFFSQRRLRWSRFGLDNNDRVNRFFIQWVLALEDNMLVPRSVSRRRYSRDDQEQQAQCRKQPEPIPPDHNDTSSSSNHCV